MGSILTYTILDAKRYFLDISILGSVSMLRVQLIDHFFEASSKAAATVGVQVGWVASTEHPFVSASGISLASFVSGALLVSQANFLVQVREDHSFWSRVLSGL